MRLQASYSKPRVQRFSFVRAAFSYIMPMVLALRKIPYSLCLTLLCLSLPNISQAYTAKASLTIQAEVNLTHKEGVTQESAASIVKALAYEKALKFAHQKLSSQRALAFGFQEKKDQLAVVTELFTTNFQQKSDNNTPSVRVSVTLSPKEASLSQAMASLVAQKSLVSLRAEWLHSLQKYAHQGEHILLMSAGLRPSSSHGPFSSLHMQADQVAKNLEALWHYYDALEYFHDLWEKPEAVTQLMYQALSLAPHAPLFWACLGEIELHMGKTHDAIKSLNKALELAPSRGRTLYIRGLAYLHLQQPSLAKVDFSAALATEPDNPQWLRVRGAARMLLEEYELMCQDLTKACAFGQCDGLQNAREKNFCLTP